MSADQRGLTEHSTLRRREVIARLAGAQKSNRGAGLYSRFVNRPLGRQLAAICYLRGLTPNQVSAISACFSYAAIAAIALFRPTWAVSVLIAAALILGYAFDSADGQVARLRGGGSPAGEWLDHVIDAVKVSALHVAVVISWYRFSGLGRGWLLIPLGFVIVYAVYYFALTLSDMLRRIARVSAGRTGVATSSVDPNEPAPLLRSLVVLPSDYGVLCLAMLFLSLHKTFATIYTLLFIANTLLVLVGCIRWYREMRTI